MGTSELDEDRLLKLKTLIEADISEQFDIEGRSDFDLLIHRINVSPNAHLEWYQPIVRLAVELRDDHKKDWWSRLERLIVLGKLQIPDLGRLLETIIAEQRCPGPIDRASIYGMLDWCRKPATPRVIAQDTELKNADRVRWLDFMIPRVSIEEAQNLTLEAAAEGRFSVEHFVQRLEDMRSISAGKFTDWARRFQAVLNEQQQLEFRAVMAAAFGAPATAALPEQSNMRPRVQPGSLARALRDIPEDDEKEFMRLKTAGDILVRREIQLRNGRDLTHSAFVESTMQYFLPTGNLLYGAALLRFFSERWRSTFSHDTVSKALDILVHRILYSDHADAVGKFISKTPKGIFRIIALVSEYHEDRVIIPLLRAILASKGGLEIEAHPYGYGGRLRGVGIPSGIPIVSMLPVQVKYKSARASPSTLFEFKGYHLFARQRWLQEQLGSSSCSYLELPNTGVKQLDLSLREKCSLAIKGDVFQAGAARFRLARAIANVAGVESQIPPSEPTSAEHFEKFMKQDNKVFLAGAIYSQIILEWFDGFDIVLMITPDEFANVLNYSASNGKGNDGTRDRGFFNKVEVKHLAKFNRSWANECINVFRVIGAFVDRVTRDDTSLSNEVKEAWSIFAFSELASSINASDDQRWAFIPRRGGAPGPFAYDNFGKVESSLAVNSP